MKKSTKKNLRTAALLYVIVLVVALGVSFAWFINNREVEVRSGDNMVITVGSHLEVGIVSNLGAVGSWGSLATINASKACPDITGDGTHFYFPTTLDTSDMPDLNDTETFIYINDQDNAEEYYIQVKLKFRTALPMDVYLSNTSQVYPEDLNTPDDLSGSISSDVIAGAVRVGISEITVDENGKEIETLKSIWIPNDRYQLIPPTEDASISFNESGEREQYGYLSPDNGVWDENTTSMVQRYWTEMDYASGRVLVGNGQLASEATTSGSQNVPAMANGGIPLLSFNGSGTMEEKVMVVRIWVEGTDREAHTNLNGGRIKYSLNFIGIEKSGYTEEEQADFNGITLGDAGLRYANGTAVGDEVLYSYNGIDWASYSASNPNFNDDVTANGNTVYIRMAESATKRPSAARKLTK
ncbi:MAG: hypothetical protein E7639_04875 [Ruminococcaceae bacterium]|nr:hypothetical protein [Oscillospiraceae bacterium]